MSKGRIFSRVTHVRPFYERAVSDLDRSMDRSLWVLVVHSIFIEGSHTTKNMASDHHCDQSPTQKGLSYKICQILFENKW
jgi:hypothetical protein